MPMISISSPTLTIPRSTRPVTTVPRPEIVNTSSTGIRNGLSISRLGSGMKLSSASISFSTDGSPSSPGSPSSAFSALPRTIGVLSPGYWYFDSSSRSSSSTRSSNSASSLATMSTLFRKTTMPGTPTWRPSRMCSRVCGIGPSGAGHHQDRAVHLGRAGDHVLDVVGVARAVDVGVVTVVRLVLHVARSRS
jgi:hypothetical protein